MRRDAVGTVLVSVVAALLVAPALPAQPAMFRGDATHTGVLRGLAAPTFGGLRWRVQTQGPVHGSPTIAGTQVFVGSSDRSLYAIERVTGRVQWRVDLGSALLSSPAVADGRVFILGLDGMLVALDATDGRIRWRYRTGPELPLRWGLESGLVYESSPVVTGDLVIVGARDGKVHAVDRATGRARWTAATGARVYASPAVAGGTVVVGAQDGTVHAFALSTGAMRWRFRTAGAALASREFGFDRTTVQSSPAIVGGVVYVGARDGFLYAIDLATGRERWRFDHKISWVNSSPAVGDGMVYAASSDGHFIQAVDAETGKERWRAPSTNIVWASPAVDRDLLYVGEGDGTLHALDRRTGAPRWRWRAPARIISTAALADGLLVVGSDDGGVYAISGGAPTLQRAVFWDSTAIGRPMSVARASLRSFLGDRGYAVLDSAALTAFVQARLRDRAPSAVVFAIDHLPATLAGGGGSTALLRRYLDAGGTVVWCGAPPTIAPATFEELKDLDRGAPERLLGVSFATANFDPLDATASTGSRAEALGLPRWWLDNWGVNPAQVTEVLARNRYGQATSWSKRFGGPAGTGFVRMPCFEGAAGRPFTYGAVQSAAEWRGTSP